MESMEQHRPREGNSERLAQQLPRQEDKGQQAEGRMESGSAADRQQAFLDHRPVRTSTLDRHNCTVLTTVEGGIALVSRYLTNIIGNKRVTHICMPVLPFEKSGDKQNSKS